VRNSPDREAFSLTAEVTSDGGNVKVCAQYTGTKESSGMSVVEVELLSGFAVLPVSLERLKANDVIKKVLMLYLCVGHIIAN